MRSDIVMVRVPHPSGQRGKRRPAVVVQSDAYAHAVGTLVVAEITSNLSMAADPVCLLIDTTTSDGLATGSSQSAVVSCLRLVTVYRGAVDQVLGRLSPVMRAQLDGCLRTALGLP